MREIHHRLILLGLLSVGLCFGAQFANPISDIADGDWIQQPSGGDGDGDHFDELDETIAATDDLTTAWRDDVAVNVVLVSLMTTLTDPGVDTGHIARFRFRKGVSGGRQLDEYYEFRQGASTNIASATEVNISATWSTFTLTPATATITDYSDLRMVTGCQEVGGGTPRHCQISTFQVEIPDAAAPGNDDTITIFIGGL